MRVFRLSAAVALVALVCAPVAAAAQSLSIPIPATPATASPYGMATKRVNNYDTTVVTFAGQRLFTIAGAIPLDASAVPPVVQRAYTINANLRDIAPAAANKGRFDSKSFRVEIRNQGGQTTLVATDDAKHQPTTIMTVTNADATVNGISKEDLAAQWRVTLQDALGRAILAGEPEYLRAQLRKMPFVLIGGVLLTLAIFWLRRWLRRRARALDAAAWQPLVFSNLLWLMTWLTIVVWVVIGFWLLTIFPATRGTATELSGRFWETVVLWVVLLAINRLMTLAIARATAAWESNVIAGPEERARVKLRRPTLTRALDNLSTIVLWAVAIVWTFSILSVSAISVLTIGAVVAFAFSFAAQSLIKDYLNGFLILAEDQYAIGDIVTIAATSGVVEDLTLRITRIRTDEGRLVTIPNSTITLVENATRGWARVDLRVPISASSDVDQATDVLQHTLDDLANDPAWSKAVLEEPKILGVDSVSYAGCVLRAWIKTAASERAAVAREINQRVEAAFRREGIAFGAPQAIVVQAPQAQPQTPAPTIPPIG